MPAPARLNASEAISVRCPCDPIHPLLGFFLCRAARRMRDPEPFAQLRGTHPCYDPAKDIVLPSWRWQWHIPDDAALQEAGGDARRALELEEARSLPGLIAMCPAAR